MPPALILLLVEAVLALVTWQVAGRRAPVAALGLLAVTAPLEVYRTPVLDVNLSLFRISVLVAAVVVLAGPRRADAWRLVREPPVWGYGALVLAMALSLVSLSDNPGLGFRVLAQVAVGVTAIVLAAALARRIADPPLVAATLVAGAGLPAVAACWQAARDALGSDPTLPLLHLLPAAEALESSRGLSYVGSTARLDASFADPNHLGAYAALTLGPCVGLLADAVRRRSGHAMAASAAMAVALVCLAIASASRSAWLAAFVCLAAAAVSLGVPMGRTLGIRGRTLIAAGAVAACSMIAVAGMPVLQQRLTSHEANAESNRTHRITLERAAEDLANHPAFGIGLADFGPRLGQGPLTSGAHSTYLTVGAELGLAGLLALVLALAGTVRILLAGVRVPDRRTRDVAIGFTCGYAGFLVASALYDLWWDDFHWVLAGCVVGMFGAVARPRLPVRVKQPLRRLRGPALP